MLENFREIKKKKNNRIYDRVEAETRESQAGF